MKALVTIPGGVECRDAPEPEAGPGEVVVRVHSCGICGSDVHGVRSRRMPQNLTLGHEFSGKIVELGRGVTSWERGQAVAVDPLGSCGTCPECVASLPLRCAIPNLGLSSPGGFAEFVAVPARQLHALPSSVNIELGSRAEPLAVALRAVSLADVGRGDPALVFGVGPIGLNVILALREAGAEPIVAVGRSPARRATSRSIGANIVYNIEQLNGDRFANDLGAAFPHIFECSGAPDAVAKLTPALSPTGTIVVVALTRAPAPVDLSALVARQQRIIGSCAFGPAEYAAAVARLPRLSGALSSMITDRVDLDGAPDAFERLAAPRDGSEKGVVTLVQPGA